MQRPKARTEGRRKKRVHAATAAAAAAAAVAATAAAASPMIPPLVHSRTARSLFFSSTSSLSLALAGAKGGSHLHRDECH